jgi:ribosomal protein L16 Arg81 hydroxylase
MPCALSNCEAFFSRKGNEAYGGHRDSDDVLVIQIAGVKRWRVYEPQQRRYTGNSPLTEAQMGQLADTFDLAPGDALFVRAGVPHRVETTGDFSLHLSFDLIDRTPNIEQITHAANTLFNQGLAPAHASPQEVVGQYVNRLQSPEFVRQLDGARQQIRQEARAFRQKMAGAHQSPFHDVKDGKVILK